jgi:hypothetical protein
MAEKQYKTLRDFYYFYLTEHQHATCRGLHLFGTFLLLVSFMLGLVTLEWYFFAAIPVLGYGFAWVGHAFFEKNKPATFTYPGYSLASDFIMFWHFVTGQLQAKRKEARRIELGENV